jgi:2-C-methyl-D-erythritol 4-phosphate cytidylyltransferase
VLNGLNKIKSNLRYVLIHDCARPFVKKQTVLKVIKGLKEYPAVIPGVRTKDTLKQIEGDLVKKTLKRDDIFSIQTPQGFRKDLIKAAYKKHKRLQMTDSAQLFEKTGHAVKVVEGDLFNFKLTYREDIYLAKAVEKYGKI